mgnify:CR=1 FL=1
MCDPDPTCVRRRTGLVLGATIACLGALTVVSGSISAPVVTGAGSYEVAVSWTDLLDQGDRAVSGFSGGSGGGSLDLGPNAVDTPLGQVVVLTAWLLVAFRQMDAVAGMLTAISVIGLGIVLYVVLFGGVTGGGEPMVMADVPVTVRFWLLAACLAAASGAVAFSVPERSTRPTVSTTRLPTLDTVRQSSGTVTESREGDAPDPSNAVERAWWDLTKQVDGDSRETRTPGDVERAAAEADLSADAVRELRRLFEDVRYGDAASTTDRCDRARELRDRLVEADTAPPDGDRPDQRGGST